MSSINSSSAATLPIFNLPYVVRTMLFKTINPVQLIRLSMYSRRLKEMLERTQYNVQSVSFSNDNYGTTIWICHGRESLGISSDPWAWAKDFTEELATIAGVPMMVREYEGCELYGIPEDKFLLFTSHFMTFLKPQKFNLTLNYSAGLIDFFAFKVTRTFGDLKISARTMAVEEFKFIVDNVQSDRLLLEFPRIEDRSELENSALEQLTNDVLGIQKELKQDKIDINNFDCISLADILTSKSRIFDLKNQARPFSHQEINTLIKSWQSGNMLEKLEKVRITCDDQHSEHFVESYDILSDVLFVENIDFENYEKIAHSVMDNGGFTIRRRTDGQLASFFVEKDAFTFLIWNDNFNYYYY